MSQLGILYGIGVGPGDAELISLKGLRLLKSAPVVAFPAGLQGAGFAQQIVSEWLRPEQFQLPLNFPYVQDTLVLEQAWQVAAEEVWHYLQQGDVVFVSEGDVSFYSTFAYLRQTLYQCYPEAQIQTIPGICSPLAAAAALGLPLTTASDRLAILPALYSVAELKSVLEWADVVVLLKVSSVYEQVWTILEKRQLLEHSYIVERATTSHQVIYQDLRDRSHLKLPYFSLLVVQVKGFHPHSHNLTVVPPFLG